MKPLLILFLIIGFCEHKVNASEPKSKSKVKTEKIYHLNYFIDVPITVGGLIASNYGTQYVSDREPKNYEEALSLTPNDVWWFDRGATRQNPAHAIDALHWSEVGFDYFKWMPMALLLDGRINDYWLDYITLYLEAQSVNAMLYLAGSIPVRRYRPLMYNPRESLERKTGGRTTNSFFSGHASTVATATFFMAKVYLDYHPEIKNKWIFYTAATIPPAVVGYFRYRGGKHFPTDIMTGILSGAASGILIPHLHKKKKSNLSYLPCAGSDYMGLYVKLDF